MEPFNTNNVNYHFCITFKYFWLLQLKVLTDFEALYEKSSEMLPYFSIGGISSQQYYTTTSVYLSASHFHLTACFPRTFSCNAVCIYFKSTLQCFWKIKLMIIVSGGGGQNRIPLGSHASVSSPEHSCAQHQSARLRPSSLPLRRLLGVPGKTPIASQGLIGLPSEGWS